MSNEHTDVVHQHTDEHNDPMNMLRGWREHFFCKQKYFCPIRSLSFLHPPLELSCGRRVGQGGGGGHSRNGAGWKAVSRYQEM